MDNAQSFENPFAVQTLGMEHYRNAVDAENQGDLWSAASHYDFAIRLFMSCNEHKRLAEVRHNRARIAEVMRDFPLAADLYRRSLEYKLLAGDLTGSTMTESQLGSVAMNLDNYDEAERLFRKALAYFKDQGDFARSCIECMHMGELKLRMKQHSLSMQWYTDAIALADSVNDDELAAQATAGLATAMVEIGNVVVLSTYIIRAIEYFAQFLMHPNYIITCRTMSRAWRRASRADRRAIKSDWRRYSSVGLRQVLADGKRSLQRRE